ncbi:MAG: metallophosphatase family protein [Gemmataceae bacterium]|nr:metallophosphatase family protein [Gemmataceae bacterium]
MIAVVSDIHANLEALRAVLDDIASCGVGSIHCLGDTVGYGPDPLPCLDLAMGFQSSLLGNHDQGALFDPEGFAGHALRAILWTRERLERDGPRQRRAERWEWLADLPRSRREGDRLFVHGSARNPLNEYVFPEDAFNQNRMERLFSHVGRHCFQGHTHVPGVFVEEPGGRHAFHSPGDIGMSWKLDERKAMVNVGSVGQPRDGDPRACWVLLDGDRVSWRRVAYDAEAARAKILAIPDLEPFLGDRLLQGR